MKEYCVYASGHCNRGPYTERKNFYRYGFISLEKLDLKISPCLKPLLTHDVRLDVSVYTWDSLVTDRAGPREILKFGNPLSLHTSRI
jgi:hypothetical protein